MAQPAQAPTDRLPWLTEVPRTPPPERKPRRRFPWEWLVAALLVLAVASGAYWLVSRQPKPSDTPDSTIDRSSPIAPVEEITDIPSVSDMTEDERVAEPESEEPAAAAEDIADETRQPARRERTRPARRTAAAPTAEAESAPAADIPAQPVVRGRIIQIGAYPTRAQADASWQYVVKKWPYLATKPKLVSPIEVQSTDGKATRMYRLQLATTSQAQSAVICQRLEAAKVSCVVVY